MQTQDDMQSLESGVLPGHMIKSCFNNYATTQQHTKEYSHFKKNPSSPLMLARSQCLFWAYTCQVERKGTGSTHTCPFDLLQPIYRIQLVLQAKYELILEAELNLYHATFTKQYQCLILRASQENPLQDLMQRKRRKEGVVVVMLADSLFPALRRFTPTLS